MRISERDKTILMAAGAIAIFLLVFFLAYKPTVTKTEALEAENLALADHLAILRAYYEDLDTYKEGISEARREIRLQTAHYPNDVRPEDQIMYAVELENNLEMDIASVSFGAPAAIMEITGVQKDEGAEELNLFPIQAHSAGLTLSCRLGYQTFKDCVDYLHATWNRTALQSVSVSYDSGTGVLVGSMSLNQYYLTGLDNAYHPTQIPGVSIGKNNIFSTIQ